MQTIRTGVLVIGGGGAAARAALEAARAGAEVMLVTKGAFGAIGTRGAGATASGFSAVGVIASPGWTGSVAPAEKANANMILSPVERAYTNILQAGLGMTDPHLARVLVEEGAANRQALLDLGATFGEAGLRSHGVPIMAALVSQIRRTNVKVQDRTMVSALLVKDGECLGAVAVQETSGEILVIEASATILGTGGDSNLFVLNLNPDCNTGDGYVLGYEAGAELMNLEFKQIFLGTICPTRNMITRGLPEHTRILNGDHQEFLARYLPSGVTEAEALAQRNGHNPFSTRDAASRFVDIAIISEVVEGRGTPKGGFYLDRSDPRIPPIAGQNEYWLYKGIDFRGPVECGVCHHCSLGGLRISDQAETTIPHLYAAGEAAAGPHGADRMGGHMLLASQVFGARAGKHAASYASRHGALSPDQRQIRAACDGIQKFSGQKGALRSAELKSKLQKAAYFDLLTIRSAESLQRFAAAVEQIEEELSKVGVTDPGS